MNQPDREGLGLPRQRNFYRYRAGIWRLFSILKPTQMGLELCSYADASTGQTADQTFGLRSV